LTKPGQTYPTKSFPVYLDLM